jgi:Mtf2 family
VETSAVAISMRGNAVSHIIALPFLFETRTILRLPRRTQKRLLSGDSKPFQSTDNSSFLKAKAAASKANSKDTNTIPTTITSAERRVFDDIFNQVAGKSTSKAGNVPQEKRDTFIDHDEILSIFSSAVSSHVAEQKALAQRPAAEAPAAQSRRLLKDEEEILQRYPKPLRKAARRAAAASIAAKEPGTLERLKPKLDTSAAPDEGQPIPAATDSGWPDFDGANAWNIDPNGEQNYLKEEAQPSIRDGSVNKTGAHRPEFQPSGLVASKKDEGIQQEIHRSLPKKPDSVDEEENRIDQQFVRPSFLIAQRTEGHFRKGLRPSFLTTDKRAEDVASFAAHYGSVRPGFIRRAEDAAMVEERLQHDPESVFQGTIHRYCREEMDKMADLFQDAMNRQGDVGVWNTCLAKVFPMIQPLDKSLRQEQSLHNGKLPQRKQVEEPSRKTQDEISDPDDPQKSITMSSAESPLPDLPPYVPPLYIISRLYPAELLLAFRLLKTKFPASPLALALLPQIRSLGPTSYVLGASTEFYNALIELRWDVYSDLKGIDGLLVEMERSGVEFNIGTWNTLVGIGAERFTDLHSPDGGVRGAAFWERQHNVKWFQKVAVEWKTVVAARLREQGLGAEISEREYGAGSLSEARPAQAEQETVWL